MLRRTFGTTTQLRGVPESVAKQLMGHSPASRVTGQHYTGQAKLGALVAALDQMAEPEGDRGRVH